jgi:thioredoxin reductase (NADPH)
MNRITKGLCTVLFLSIGAYIGWWFASTKSDDGYTKHKTHVSLNDIENTKNIIPIAVLGSGPAGLSAALYGARSNIYTVVFQGSKPGGQLTETSYVENWPGTPKMLGVDLINQNQKQAERFGAIMVNESITSIDTSVWPFKLTTEQGDVVNALSVVLATGSTPNKLGIPGEDKYWGMGVTTCAICDAPYYKDKNVVVIGGGDSAVEEATLLASFARNVTMFVRKDKLRAAPAMQSRLNQYPNISVQFHTEITEVKGDSSGVTGMTVYNNETKTSKDEPIDGVFLAIGHQPNSTFLKDQIVTNDQGYVLIEPRGQETSKEGIFSAGDLSDPHFKQAGIAAGDGSRAGLEAITFLADHDIDDAFLDTIQDQYYDPSFDQETADIRTISTAEEFKEFVRDSKDPVVVDFYAPSCVSCMNMIPHLASVAAKFADQATFVKINRDESRQLADKLNVKSVPHILIFKDGKEIKRIKSSLSKWELLKMVNEVIYSQ